MALVNAHLAEAKRLLTIAESDDAKRAAYEQVAEEILAAMTEDPSLTQVAVGKQIDKSGAWVSDLLGWYRIQGPDRPAAPWVSDTARRTRDYERKVPTRHEDRVEMASKLLADRTVAAEVIEELPAEAVETVSEAVEQTRVNRTLYPDRPRPTVAESGRQAAASDASRRRNNPALAWATFGAALGRTSASVRALMYAYQDFLALCDDENYLGEAREDLIEFQTAVNLAVDKALSGSWEEALASLLTKEA